MLYKISLAILFAFVLSITPQVLGVDVVRTQTFSDRITKGRNFDFLFEGLPAHNGDPGTLKLHASGDFVHEGRVIDGEFLSWNMEDVLSVERVGNFLGDRSSSGVILSSVGGPFDFVNYLGGIGSIEFQRSYEISSSELTELLADGKVEIFVDWMDSVDSGRFMSATLEYAAIPEPDGLRIAWLGALVLIVIRHRR